MNWRRTHDAHGESLDIWMNMMHMLSENGSMFALHIFSVSVFLFAHTHDIIFEYNIDHQIFIMGGIRIWAVTFREYLFID